MILCARCGEELTAPKFHNGKPYGYSCYNFIAGKKATDKRKFVEVFPVEPIPTTGHFSLTVVYKDKRYSVGGVLRDLDGKLHNKFMQFTDQGLFMVTHDKAGRALWKSIQ